VQQRKRRKKKKAFFFAALQLSCSAAKKEEEEDFSSLLQTNKQKKQKENISILPFRGHVGLAPTPADPAPSPAARGLWSSGDGVRGGGVGRW